MDLEETEYTNDCAGEGQLQFNQPTDPGWSRCDLLLLEAGS
jgi:hypothetical protein